MKEILYLMVRAEVKTNFKNISETIHEIEKDAVLVISDTPNVQILDAEFLLTRFRKPKK